MNDAPTPASTAPLPFDEALDAILRQADGHTTETEQLALVQSLGRALSASVRSRVALPPWDNAGMDGYAVQRADVMGATRAAPRVMPILGISAAGADATALPWVQQGTALRIMTGAPMPPGADAVIRIEDTDGGIERVSVFDDRDAQGRANVRPRGEDVAAGSELFARGTTIGASHLGVLASIGAHTVPVYRTPRVTIVSSGDELVLLDRFEEVEAGQRIVSSSSYALPALLRSAGADVRTVPLVPDTLHALTDALAGALDGGCDLLITTGGVSVGAHDYTREALAALGGRQTFWRARIRPGGPIGTGMVRNVPWLGLPGNPVSTMVTGALFAWPLIRLLGGHAGYRPLRIPVRFLDSAETPAPLTHFLRVVLTAGADGMPEARLAGPQGSNLLRTMALANALLMIPPDVSRADVGTTFTAILLPDVPLMTS
ncbi:gephyrin-like molybdotransferase Glp [Gemmatimonas groenlandica]|uniref:Molybdopterin molybdenumtransferase n=1 Tax=Gemmatimonas groenlandica TaxID=2732249 RepID=A0A6M4IKL5_9BACT|nr:gephyrin-like molybdotransferase Glp [Gemmatimonas groenlandica]QJR34408.1 molybdopterin molybdotransferase MoeA [Gemmatimonas groenlandica]